MNGFAVCAFLLAAGAAAVLVWPLLRRRAAVAPAPVAAVVGALAIIAGGACFYSRVGAPASARTRPDEGDDRSVSVLARHLEDQPDDRDGWMQLGGAYSQIGQF